MAQVGWYAIREDDEWKPALYVTTTDKEVLELSIWFYSEIECLQWIDKNLIGMQFTLDSAVKLGRHNGRG